MARPSILFALLAVVLALATNSVQGRKAENHHDPPPPPAIIKNHQYHHPPHPFSVLDEGGDLKRHAPKNHPHIIWRHKPRSSRHARAAAAPSPVSDFVAERCLKRLTEKCDWEIFRSLLISSGEDGAAILISDKCCMKLVAVGRRCRRWMMKATVALQAPIKSDHEKREMIKKRDARVWSKCANSVTNAYGRSSRSPSPSPSPSLSPY